MDEDILVAAQALARLWRNELTSQSDVWFPCSDLDQLLRQRLAASRRAYLRRSSSKQINAISDSLRRLLSDVSVEVLIREIAKVERPLDTATSSSSSGVGSHQQNVSNRLSPTQVVNVQFNSQVGNANQNGTQHNEGSKNTMGDTINISNVTNSNLNIKSQLDQVTQRIATLPHAEASQKATLQDLLTQLSTELQKAPPESAADVEAIIELAKDVVDKVCKEKPNKVLVNISAEGLKQAAANLGAVLPTVIPIAAKIAEQIRLLLP